MKLFFLIILTSIIYSCSIDSQSNISKNDRLKLQRIWSNKYKTYKDTFDNVLQQYEKNNYKLEDINTDLKSINTSFAMAKFRVNKNLLNIFRNSINDLSKDTQWACKKCSFLNEDTSFKCKICNNYNYNTDQFDGFHLIKHGKWDKLKGYINVQTYNLKCKYNIASREKPNSTIRKVIEKDIENIGHNIKEILTQLKLINSDRYNELIKYLENENFIKVTDTSINHFTFHNLITNNKSNKKTRKKPHSNKHIILYDNKNKNQKIKYNCNKFFNNILLENHNNKIEYLKAIIESAINYIRKNKNLSDDELYAMDTHLELQLQEVKKLSIYLYIELQQKVIQSKQNRSSLKIKKKNNKSKNPHNKKESINNLKISSKSRKTSIKEKNINNLKNDDNSIDKNYEEEQKNNNDSSHYNNVKINKKDNNTNNFKKKNNFNITDTEKKRKRYNNFKNNFPNFDKNKKEKRNKIRNNFYQE